MRIISSTVFLFQLQPCLESGDPAVVDGAEIVPSAFSAADLLMAVAVKLPPF